MNIIRANINSDFNVSVKVYSSLLIITSIFFNTLIFFFNYSSFLNFNIFLIFLGIYMTFIIGIILAASFFFFHNEIFAFFVSSGLRDALVEWLQSLN